MAKGTIDMARQQLPLLINDVMAGGKSVGVSITASNPVYFVSRPSRDQIFCGSQGEDADYNESS
jgi:hypothetical protein